MGVVDVEACPIGQDCVGEVRLNHRRQGARTDRAPGVVARRLVVEVPADVVGKARGEGVDEQGRGDDRVGVALSGGDAVLGLDADELRDGHDVPV